MPSVYRVTAIWDNFAGGPGYSKFSFLDLGTDTANNAAGAALRTFFSSFTAELVNGSSITISREVQEYDEVTGLLLDESVMTVPPAPVQGTAAGGFAGGAGAFVAWKTGTIWQGRRVQGRTFLAPLVGVFDFNGSLIDTFLATAQGAADALIADPGSTLAVWAKVFNKTVSPPVQTNGAAFQVTTSLVKDQTSGLRSRRQHA